MTSMGQNLGQMGVPTELPIHFFTIVLNGQPFIEYHLQVFQALELPWHWHVIEGVAELKHDTAWSVAQGGRIDPSLHRNGLSIDGTTEYLDGIAARLPEHITLYRPPPGQFWDGKREMVNAPLRNIQADCLLWQIDADELWTTGQITTTHALFVRNPDLTAAFYWCHYFVGPHLMVASRYCYSQNPEQEWLRTWRYQPGMSWAKHEPPQLVNLQGEDVSRINPIYHDDTEALGLVFQHFAYVLPEQITFKEKYYGYRDALSQWQRLQSESGFPVFLRNYFAWVTDDTVVDLAAHCGVLPVAVADQAQESRPAWHFRTESELAEIPRPSPNAAPKIAVDAVFFQLLHSGIGRVWRSIFQAWVESGFAENVLILDRAQTAPRLPGLRYRLIHPYNQEAAGEDSLKLQAICDQAGIELFISTYYTTPIHTPTVLLVHDMIPEVLGFDLTVSGWREKQLAILYASAYLTVSKHTAKDLIRFFPGLDQSQIYLTYNGLDSTFQPANEAQIQVFRKSMNLEKPYFLVVGDRVGFDGYKNIQLFFTAFNQISNKAALQIFCVGGQSKLEPELAQIVSHESIKMARLTDAELAIAYSGAIALVYPSRYEGFGLPVLEAMACGCPVITCHNSAIPEVAGTAALYVSANDPTDMIHALAKVQIPDVRPGLIQAGLAQSRQFSWTTMAGEVANVLTRVLQQQAEQGETPASFKQKLIWQKFRHLQAELAKTQAPGQDTFGLEHLLFLVQEMESSKFWQLRRMAHKLKKLIGQPGLVDEVIIDPAKPPELQLLQAKQRINWIKTSKFWQLRKRWLKLRQNLGLPGDDPDSPLV